MRNVRLMFRPFGIRGKRNLDVYKKYHLRAYILFFPGEKEVIKKYKEILKVFIDTYFNVFPVSSDKNLSLMKVLLKSPNINFEFFCDESMPSGYKMLRFPGLYTGTYCITDSGTGYFILDSEDQSRITQFIDRLG